MYWQSFGAKNSAASKNWEGLSLSLVFSEDRSTFSGALMGTDTSGSGLTHQYNPLADFRY